MLAHAVNELIGHRPVIYAPYSADLTGAHGAEHEENKSFAQDDDADDG